MKSRQQQKAELRRRITYAVTAMPEEKNVDIAKLLKCSAMTVSRVRRGMK
jgi:hypothetical protein